MCTCTPSGKRCSEANKLRGIMLARHKEYKRKPGKDTIKRWHQAARWLSNHLAGNVSAQRRKAG